MKIIPPTCPEPESGRKYWRSLEQLAETPEFRLWAEREFPAGRVLAAKDFMRYEIKSVKHAESA